MQHLVMLAIAGIFGGLLLTPGAPAGAAPSQRSAAAQAANTDVSAQNRRRVPQLRVTPRSRYPYRTTNLPYPVPYPIESPGPNTVRQCVANYVQEFRPSGTVIVPRMRCWWARAGG